MYLDADVYNVLFVSANMNDLTQHIRLVWLALHMFIYQKHHFYIYWLVKMSSVAIRKQVSFNLTIGECVNSSGIKCAFHLGSFHRIDAKVSFVSP